MHGMADQAFGQSAITTRNVWHRKAVAKPLGLQCRQRQAVMATRIGNKVAGGAEKSEAARSVRLPMTEIAVVENRLILRSNGSRSAIEDKKTGIDRFPGWFTSSL
jgi:hypothetical protein